MPFDNLTFMSSLIKEICTLLGCYAALSSSSVPTFRDNVLVLYPRAKKSKKKSFFLDFLTLEDGTDRLSRNVGIELPLNAA
jgi:hypothetical protein